LSPFESDEFGKRRAFVNLVTTRKLLLLERDGSSRGPTRSSFGGTPASIEYFYDNAWHAAPPPAGKVRDGLGTTHHEAGTLWMGTTGQFHPESRWKFHHIQTGTLPDRPHSRIGFGEPSLTAFTLPNERPSACTKAVPSRGQRAFSS